MSSSRASSRVLKKLRGCLHIARNVEVKHDSGQGMDVAVIAQSNVELDHVISAKRQEDLIMPG